MGEAVANDYVEQYDEPCTDQTHHVIGPLRKNLVPYDEAYGWGAETDPDDRHALTHVTVITENLGFDSRKACKRFMRTRRVIKFIHQERRQVDAGADAKQFMAMDLHSS